MKLCCPHCGVKGSTDDAYEGRLISCPKCGLKFKAKHQEDDGATQADVDDSSDMIAESPGIAVEEHGAGAEEEAESSASEYTIVRLQDYLDEELSDEDLRREPVMHGDESESAELESTDIESAEVESVEIYPGEEEMHREEDGEIQSRQSSEGDLTNYSEWSQERTGYQPAMKACERCGKVAEEGEIFIQLQGGQYCPACGPEVEDEIFTSAQVAAAEATSLSTGNFHAGPDIDAEPQEIDFRIGHVLRHAWRMTKGTKMPIWVGLLVTYGALTGVMVILGLVLAYTGQDLGTAAGNVLDIGGSLLSSILTAGLMYMGVKRATGRRIIWKDVCSGFPVAGKLIVAAVLQTVLIVIGLLLFILPGIYLMVGYMLAMPLIVDRNISPWQAMEISRKAIHKVWWKIFALYLIVLLLCSLSALLFGIGLIWTIPMSVMVFGVVYNSLLPGCDNNRT